MAALGYNVASQARTINSPLVDNNYTGFGVGVLRPYTFSTNCDVMTQLVQQYFHFGRWMYYIY